MITSAVSPEHQIPPVEGRFSVAIPVYNASEAIASKYGVGNRLWVGIVDMLGVIWLQRRAKQTAADEVNEMDHQS